MKQTREYQPNLLLRQARLQRGWSQQRLADLISAPGAYMVNRWEQGSIFPTVGRFLTRASVLETYLEEACMNSSMVAR
jgi:transcriptional regulator with XRE-family HTH domain